jgi:hypothetical protein
LAGIALTICQLIATFEQIFPSLQKKRFLMFPIPLPEFLWFLQPGHLFVSYAFFVLFLGCAALGTYVMVKYPRTVKSSKFLERNIDAVRVVIMILWAILALVLGAYFLIVYFLVSATPFYRGLFNS